MDRIRHFYSEPEPEWLAERPYPYLNEASMRRFVDNTVLAIDYLLDNLATLPDGVSAVSLLSEEQLAPFSIPLGDSIRDLRGKLTWDGELDSSRLDKS
jgi:hypothetical protein